jgi:two-component system, OmpR family, phosphate regulon sensor histidine kinase PhoR
MHRNKNTITLILMSSSIVLLVILQIFWLRGSYEKAFFDFRREGNTIFKTTVFGLRDSMILTNFEQLPGDSVEKILIRKNIRPARGNTRQVKADTVTQYIDIHEERAQVQIFVSDSSDIITENIIGPISSKIQDIQYQRTPGAKRTFTLRLGPDTLHLDTLSKHFSKALHSAGIYTPFLVKHAVRTDRFKHRFTPRLFNRDGSDQHESGPIRIFSDTLQSESVQINPLHHYQASLTGMRKLLFKEIGTQILFSIFLTLITTASFVFMFRNIREQQKLMASKNEFISNVTHELKTPVATVSVAIEALKNFNARNNPELTNEYLDIAQRELNRLSMMTDKILEASVFESRGLEFEEELIDLDVIVRQMMVSMKMQFEKRGAIVNYHPEGSSFIISGGAMHITNVIYNLMDNALKYSPKNPVIDVLLKSSGHHIILSVKDNGIGIAPEYKGKIFEKFFRIPTGDIHDTKGYGLGLSYVASVVKSHSATIAVDSEPGVGSEFKITFRKTEVRN